MSGLARALGAVVVGIHSHIVEVEVQLHAGLPQITVVGLPDAAVSESRDRARAALQSSGFEWPRARITVGLSPAALPKKGATLDLPIALSILAAAGVYRAADLGRTVVLGELGLDGAVRPVRGVISVVAELHRQGIRRVVVPVANLREAQLVSGVVPVGVRSLRQAVDVIVGADEGVTTAPEGDLAPPAATLDLKDVRGQAHARRALEVAAAGGHHVVMSGPPGVGKTLLAERIPGLLPDLDEATALECTTVHSVEGLLGDVPRLMSRPPFFAPHHSSTRAALVGGGSGHHIRAGAVSLAHGGVLFLDEACEFPRTVLDALRQPLETGSAHVHRSGFVAVLPARVLLVLATNPCPCGHFGKSRCSCSYSQMRRYAARISGPLLDRMDLRVRVEAPTRADLAHEGEPESSVEVARRVREARGRAVHRWKSDGWRVNSEVPGPELRRRYPASGQAMSVLDREVERDELTMRGADRVLRVAWTLADLAGRSKPSVGDVRNALELRGVDTPWGA